MLQMFKVKIKFSLQKLWEVFHLRKFASLCVFSRLFFYIVIANNDK